MGVINNVWRALAQGVRDTAPAPDLLEPTTERDYLLSLDAALEGSEIAVTAIAGVLTDIAHGRRLSAVEVSEKRIACGKYIDNLRAARAVIRDHLEGRDRGQG